MRKKIKPSRDRSEYHYWWAWHPVVTRPYDYPKHKPDMWVAFETVWRKIELSSTGTNIYTYVRLP